MFWVHPQGCATLTVVLGHFVSPPKETPYPARPPPVATTSLLLLPASLSAALPARVPGFPPRVTESNPSFPVPPSSQCCSERHSQHLLKYPNQPPAHSQTTSPVHLPIATLMAARGENLAKPSRRPPSLPSPYPQENIQKAPGSLPATSPSSFHPHSDFFLPCSVA